MAYVKAVDYHSEGNKKALWHTVAGIGICNVTEDFNWLFNTVKDNAESFRNYFKTANYNTTGDYKITFFVNGLYAIITTWLDNNCAETVEQMNEIVMRECRKFHNLNF